MTPPESILLQRAPPARHLPGLPGVARLAAILAVMAHKAREGGLPLWRQGVEMAYLFARFRLGPGYYLMARFWRREIPFARKCQHWNGERYLRFVHRINDPRYFKVSQNKLVEKALLRGLGIPAVAAVGLFHQEKGQCMDGTPLTCLEDLRRLLPALASRRFFCKPAEGDSGEGVFSFRVAADGLLRDGLSGERLELPALALRLAECPQGYLIEQAIEQHPLLAALNPTSVNTLRMWVVHDCRGVGVVGAFLRVGRAGSLTDNTAGGGLACAVDVDTGLVREALDLTLERKAYVDHPDSGARLLGLQIPCWDECCRLACNALRVLPGARFAGMDIAVTSNGPLVVEYNVEANQRGATHFDVPHGVLFSGFRDG